MNVYTKVNIALEICNSNEIDSVFSDIIWESIAVVMEDVSNYYTYTYVVQYTIQFYIFTGCFNEDSRCT